MAILTKLAIGTVFIALAVYIFGIPPQIKRKLQRGALQAMGENQASYVIKDQIEKLPTTDQRDLRKLKRDIGSATDSLTKNSVGQEAGEAFDGLSRDISGR